MNQKVVAIQREVFPLTTSKMYSLSGYVLTSELARFASITPSLFHTSYKDCVVEKFCGASFVKKDTVPIKYEKFISSCTVLDEYYPITGLERILDLTHRWFKRNHEKGKIDLAYLYIGKLCFVKLNESFLNLLNSGLTPFVLNDEYDESMSMYSCELYGLKIGFY